MCFNVLLREERKRKRLSQQQLGVLVGYSQSDVSEWEAGNREVPIDIKKKLPDILESSRLRLELINELQADFIVTPYFNGVCSTDLVRLLAKNIEEEEESINAQREIFQIVLDNMTGKSFTDKQLEKIEDLMEQVADPVGWKRMLFAAIEEETGIRISNIQKRITNKLKVKKYVVNV